MQNESIHPSPVKAKPIVYGSVCSGIESATVAWHPLGWCPAFFSEIDHFPRAVLQHHYAHVPLHGDFTTIGKDTYDPIDLLVGGTPCQSFSLAGLRKGLADERGNLTLEFVRLAQRLRPRWLVWENVPGVLSIDRGRAFGSFLGALAELGYGFAYRVLDAQYFGLAQRRQRVFLVGHLGDWRPPAAVLFESESLRRDTTPCREAGKAVAALTANGTGTCGADDNQGQAGHLIAYGGNNTSGGIDVATAVNAHGGPHGRLDFENETFVSQPYTLAIRGREDTHRLEYRQDGLANAILTPNGGRAGIGVGAVAIPLQEVGKRTGISTDDQRAGLGIGQDGDPMFTLQAGAQHGVAAIPIHDKATRHKGGGDTRNDDGCSNGLGIGSPGDPCPTLDTASKHGVAAFEAGQCMAVRRITVTEAERLQGFPDGFTAIPWRGKPASECPDGPRYKAIGNSMAVPCMAWIGRRIQMVEDLQAELAA